MLIAFDVIFTRVLALNMPLTKIGLGFAAVMVCGMLYGPGWAGGLRRAGRPCRLASVPDGSVFPRLHRHGRHRRRDPRALRFITGA